MSSGRRPRVLARVAARAEVPVFLARGLGAAEVDVRLRASRHVAMVDSPRAATVLVVAGSIPSGLVEALARVHDQMAHPRATVWWTGDAAGAVPEGWPVADIVGPDDDIDAAVVAAHHGLLTGGRASDPPLLPDVDPAPWRGVGPYGHGGTGMTGGVPFGRPMAGRGDDRDGLTLDVVPVRLGPFLPALPSCLVLEVTFAGDVVHDVTIPPLPEAEGGALGARLDAEAAAPLLAAVERPVAVADVERERARHHLRWLSWFLHLQGLDSLARRVAKASLALPAEPGELAMLARQLDRPWVLGRATRGVGAVVGADAAAWGGPVARAAGVGTDARAQSPAYAALGFEPVVHQAGDVRDRWRQRLAEAAQAVVLAGRAGPARVEPGAPLEPPVPPPPADARERLAGMLVGAEWGDAVSIVASFDPHLEATAAPAGTAP